MLDGWYCRNQQNANQDDDDSDSDPDDSRTTDYKEQYRYLKKKMKLLIYENEGFQDALRSSQKKFLKVTRDRSFLLDRLLQYDKPSESDETESSSDERNELKKQKNSNIQTGSTRGRKRKNFTNISHQVKLGKSQGGTAMQPDSQMTPEEIAIINKHLQSRVSRDEMIQPERNVPNEMFSNEPSLDSESNDQTPPSE